MKKMMKKWFAVTWILVVGVLIFTNPKICQASQISARSGYTPIYTIEDLYGINDDLSGKYILMNDIDLSETKPGGDWDSGSGWTPIGINTTKAFNGILDGNGYCIENLSIHADTEGKGMYDELRRGQGIFYNIGEGGIVRNVGLKNIDISFTGTGNAGGIAWNSSGTIQNCFVTGKMSATDGILGGIVGCIEDGEIKNCYSAVDITFTKTNTSGRLGGIAGWQEIYKSAKISNCYFNGSIQTDQIYHIGPIVGDYSNGALISNKHNYYTSKAGCDDTLEKDTAKGVKLTPAQMKMQKCFTGFDFKNTWILDKNSSYPYPQLRNCMQVNVTSIELLAKPTKLKYTTADTLDFTGSKLKINYEDGYTATTKLTEDMVTYEMKQGTQTVDIDFCGQTANFDITVTKAKESLSVTAKKTKLKVGVSYTYKVKYVGSGTVTFTSTNSSVLKINQKSGKAVAKKKGTATITIQGGSLSKKIKVTVV